MTSKVVELDSEGISSRVPVRVITYVWTEQAEEMVRSRVESNVMHVVDGLFEIEYVKV
jgi:hypothetical protein